MEKITLKAIEELKKFRNCFKSTLGFQKYEVNVFDALNERYIEAGKLIDEFERGQKAHTSDSNCNIPHVSNSIAIEYAEFCVRCDREKLPLICLEDYIKQYCC